MKTLHGKVPVHSFPLLITDMQRNPFCNSLLCSSCILSSFSSGWCSYRLQGSIPCISQGAEAEEIRKVLWLHFFPQLRNNDRKTHAWLTHLWKIYFEIGQSHWVEKWGEETQCKPPEQLHYSVVCLSWWTSQYLGQIYVRIICFLPAVIY